MINSYPKIFNLGHRQVLDVFDDDVVIEEKVDGSQISFGVFDGELKIRSRKKQLDLEYPDKMFSKAVEEIKKRKDILIPNAIYRGEYLEKPKHNVLAYDRVPKGNIILFDIEIGEQCFLSYIEKVEEAKKIDLEVVPLVYQGKVDSFDEFKDILEKISILGGQKIEGMVIKNYHKFGLDKKVLMAKFVSEAFKEVHRKDWKKNNPTNKDFIYALGIKYKSEARWNKAVQHLKEQGKIFNDPKDIGLLCKEVNQDVLEECKEDIKDELFKYAWSKISKIAIRGLAEWYKEKLAKEYFDEKEAS